MKLIIVVFSALIIAQTPNQPKPELRNADKIRIREAIKISNEFGEKIFSGWMAVPFAILLVTDSTEFLIHHPNPSPDFTLSGYDEMLKSNVYFRKRQYNLDLLATFPAVNGLSCIVVGTPENTGKNSTEWIITLLHEHFHQYQNSDPNYFQSVADLNLSNGDQTGMWMLNYPFPYDSLVVKKQYEFYTQALYKTVTDPNDKDYKTNIKNYIAERSKFRNLLSTADYRYFSFQVWQEGLARYAEYNFLSQLTNYIPSKEVLELSDYMPFSELKSKMYRDETNKLLNNKLDKSKRVCFYSIGFAEGIILDKQKTDWRKNYLKEKFYVEKYRN